MQKYEYSKTLRIFSGTGIKGYNLKKGKFSLDDMLAENIYSLFGNLRVDYSTMVIC